MAIHGLPASCFPEPYSEPSFTSTPHSLEELQIPFTQLENSIGGDETFLDASHVPWSPYAAQCSGSVSYQSLNTLPAVDTYDHSAFLKNSIENFLEPNSGDVDSPISFMHEATLEDISTSTTLQGRITSSRPIQTLDAEHSPQHGSITSESSNSLQPTPSQPSTPKSPELTPKSLQPNSSRITKRKLNTLAARRYRQKRIDQVSGLEVALKETEEERDALKIQVARLQGELEALRGLARPGR